VAAAQAWRRRPVPPRSTLFRSQPLDQESTA
jgi:hypothetical protein